MEHVASFSTPKESTWINKRCRAFVHTILESLTYGQVEIVEDNKHFLFPQKACKDMIKGHILVHDISLYQDFLQGGSIGVAEAFIDGKWSSPNLTNVIRIFAKAQQQIDTLEAKRTWKNKIKNMLFHWKNRNTQSGSKRNILAHYDLGNELYTRFLDPKMMYSSAIYPNETSTLDEAQSYKLQTICERLSLKSADHLLEIGTGWGGLAIYAAQHYGCKVTTTTISDAQFAYAHAQVLKLGLEDQITLLKDDYRDLTGKYDKVVSIEMIEAVGYKFLPSFFQQCNDRLKPGGKVLIQAITIADQRFEYYKNNVDFIQKYIFPGGFLPSVNTLS
ncbi:SAM-dependent methyltransferase, partial [Paraglaciecola sp.]|uniref:SAM-dependent methyltransferase n=1 Tax=Paraglaciecola sp. TaxID=1920173 RepID=UPI003EF0AAE9